MTRELRHLGIIPDGTRRWARRNKFTYYEAYWLALQKLTLLIDTAFAYGVTTQSIYLLSKDNLRREHSDLEAVLQAEKRFFLELLPNLAQKWQCSIIHAGRLDILPRWFAISLESACKDLDSMADRRINLLVGYDPVDELLQAVSVNPNKFWNHLWVSEQVDLVVRTGHGQLLSNFLPLQCGYAELKFFTKLFNDLQIDDLVDAILDYSNGGDRLMGR